MSVVVRAQRDFTAYHGPTCQLLSFRSGQEVTGDIAVFLATTGTPVEVVTDEFDSISAALAAAAGVTPAPADEAAADPAVDSAAQDEDDAPSDSQDDETGTDDEADDESAVPSADAADFDPAEHNVRDVLAHVEAHPEQLATVLAAERAGKQRTTLLEALADLTPGQA